MKSIIFFLLKACDPIFLIRREKFLAMFGMLFHHMFLLLQCGMRADARRYAMRIEEGGKQSLP